MKSQDSAHFATPALLLKVRGGLADTLYQIYKAMSYARKHGRTLYIDSRGSGLKCQLDELFVLPDDLHPSIFIATDDVQRSMDEITSVYPAELAGRVSSYTSYRDENYEFFDYETDRNLTFNWRDTRDEALIVVERAGGNSKNWTVFNRFQLVPRVSSALRNRLAVLPRGYHGVHIRHSDYKTDYKGFLRRLAPLVAGKNLVICADNKRVKDLAVRYLSSYAQIIELTDLPQLDGKPIHETTTESGFDDALDALTDLFALACAQKIHFTELAKTPDQSFYFKFSGFVVLASRIRFRKKVLAKTLSISMVELAEIFQPQTKHEPLTKFSPRDRMCARLLEWKWNFNAKKTVLKTWLY